MLTLFTGFFCLILAPEFYQPLRDLGTYYHDRAAGIGAADAIVDFLEADYLIAHQAMNKFQHKVRSKFRLKI